jgi:DNA replication ATP-dependent helicase Dna2
MWRSYNSGTRSAGGVSSIVIDASQGMPYSKSHENNSFVYRFVPHDTSCPSIVSDDDPSSASVKNGLDLTLRSGDYVVWIKLSFTHFEFSHVMFTCSS